MSIWIRKICVRINFSAPFRKNSEKIWLKLQFLFPDKIINLCNYFHTSVELN